MMKARNPKIPLLCIFLLGCTALAAQPLSGSVYSPLSGSGTEEHDAFSSTMMYHSSYTVAFSAQDLEHVGATDGPEWVSPIYKAPPAPGGPGWIDPGTDPNKPDITFGSVEDGTAVLLACMIVLFVFRIVCSKRVRTADR